MRHIAILIMILSIAVSANAEIFITVDGEVNPSEIDLIPNSTASIGLWGEWPTTYSRHILGILEDNPGLFDISNVIIPLGAPLVEVDLGFWEPSGLKMPIIGFHLVDLEPPPYIGQLVDNITFTCDGPGDVTMILSSILGDLWDSQTIHQVPEPGTIVLLGLGALMLKGRR
ncbi:MAG: PEP-CTERM sorting domain-containing protein [Sedimentisphaerales bacterium]|nr:PEP-CTERM sorting domain-containing protein [Sedimentisphaerales bacterium]